MEKDFFYDIDPPPLLHMRFLEGGMLKFHLKYFYSVFPSSGCLVKWSSLPSVARRAPLTPSLDPPLPPTELSEEAAAALFLQATTRTRGRPGGRGSGGRAACSTPRLQDVGHRGQVTLFLDVQCLLLFYCYNPGRLTGAVCAYKLVSISYGGPLVLAFVSSPNDSVSRIIQSCC